MLCLKEKNLEMFSTKKDTPNSKRRLQDVRIHKLERDSETLAKIRERNNEKQKTRTLKFNELFKQLNEILFPYDNSQMRTRAIILSTAIEHLLYYQKEQQR